MDHETALRNAEGRLRISEALVVVAADPRAVFDLLVDAASREDARVGLRERFGLDEVQASAVLDMQFRWFTAADRQKITDGHRELTTLVAELRRGPRPG